MTTALLAALLLALGSQGDPAQQSHQAEQPPEVQAESTDWLRFRGGAGTSVMEQRGFPGTWSADENLAWSVEVEGAGWSSPIVVGEQVFLTAAVGEQSSGPKGFSGGVTDPSTRGGGAKPADELTFRVLCLSIVDGSSIWSRDVGQKVPAYPVHASNTFATETPTSDGERVFATFGALGELVCFNLEGDELWRVETGVFKTGNDFGWGISLVTADGLVFLQNDNEQSSFLAAFDTKTGEERWRAKRDAGTSWGTPVLWQVEGGTRLVACGPDAVVAYEPSSGKEVWRVRGFGGSFSASPTYDAGHLYIGNSGPMSRGPLVAIPAKTRGLVDLRDDDESDVAWAVGRAGPGFSSPVVHDGLLYVIGSSTMLACHDAATGERLWRERLPDAETIVATPWIAGGEIYVLDEAGTTFVVRAAPQFELLRLNRIDGLYWGTPSVAGNALLIRAADRLHCIRES